MTDIVLFIRNGWKNVWKQNIIWLFSAFLFSDKLFRVVQIKHEQNLPWSLFYLIGSFIPLILIYVSLIGVPYLAYCSSTGRLVTIQETLFAIRKFSRRVIGFYCLGVLLFSPCVFLTFAIYTNYSTQPFLTSNTATLFFSVASIFGAMLDFSIFGFFANDFGIRESVKSAWDFFTSNFSSLATLGIIMTVIFRTYIIVFGIITMLIQSGFDMSSLGNINYINPYSSLSKNILYVSLSIIGFIIFRPFNTSVFAAAYLKYSGVKIPLSIRQS